MLLLLASLRAAAADEFLDSDQWYARMREPWQPATTGFIRDWLVVGEFPNPPSAGQATYDHTEPCAGCDTDYLLEHGGEEKIRPVEGMTHLRPDGSTATWHRVESGQDVIDFLSALPPRSNDNGVAYAFATFRRDAAGQAMMAVGSDDGVMVWVNGRLVHRNIVGRPVIVDNDLFPVEFNAGENSVLVKVEQGGGAWGFCCRLIDEASLHALPWKAFNPSLSSPANAATLTVRSDSFSEADRPVRVEIVGAGGAVVASRDVSRGEAVDFDTTPWPDGAYEARCAIELPFGEKQYRHLAWYKGDAAAAVQRLLEAARGADSNTAYGITVQMLAELVADRLGGDTTRVPDEKLSALHSPLMEVEELELERRHAGSRIRPLGFVRLAYRDEVDDSPQFGRLYLPPDYDPSRPWPVIVYLHGYNPENPVYIHWWAIDQRHQPRAETTGAIYIEPHGRGNTWYLGIGDRDVVRCLSMAKDLLNVDDDRVYLTGESMGGGGTWNVGTRHPGLFAAIAPAFGGWDYRASQTEESWKRMTPHQQFARESWSSIVQAESLLTTPIFVNHGDADSIVSVDWSRFMVRQIQRWGYDIRYRETPGGGHFDSGYWPEILSWLMQQKRNAHPRHVRVRAASLTSAEAHWLRVEQYERPLEMMMADAEVVAPNVVKVDSQNVLALSLAPAGDLADSAKPLTVVWNKRTIADAPWRDGRVTIRGDGFPSGPLLKRPALAGPVENVRLTPYAIVLGTTSTDALMRAFCERRARTLAEEWMNWQNYPARFYRDTDLSDADAAAYSLILVGGPEANAVTRKLIERLPLRIGNGSVRLDGRTFDAPDAALQVAYPNPLNPDRYVLVQAATSARAMYHLDRLADDFDFCIADGRRYDDEDRRPLEKVVVAAGSFDTAWHITDAALFQGDAEARARSPMRHVPSHADARVEETALYLSDLLDQKSVGCFQRMELDANAHGEPLRLGERVYEHGLGVPPWSDPGTAEWNLSGGGWKFLRGTIGVEFNDPAHVSDLDREHVRVLFVVSGDGKELFRSEPFTTASIPQPIDIAVAGVTNLQLLVHNEAPWSEAPKSADWAELRLER